MLFGNRNYSKIFWVFAISLILAGCASQPNVNSYGAPGLFSGLMHGFFLLFAFVGSLFIDEISIYAFPNSGGWYDFGFIIGIAFFSYLTDQGAEQASS